jgi:molecular chaperone GrpE
MAEPRQKSNGTPPEGGVPRMGTQPPDAAGQPEPDALVAGEAPATAAEPSADEVGEQADIAEHDDGAQVSLDLDELAAKAAERDEYLALAQRTQADFENYRKRVARETRAAEARGVGRLARELLPALDNLDRALAAASEGEGQLVEGMRLVRAELHAALARVGIESYEPAGERFDPELHEAMAQQPVEGAEPGTIVEVYQAGYRLDGMVIRPARVVVAGEVST